MDIDQTLLGKLINESPEFKKLFDEHTNLKNRVEEMNQRKFLSPKEELEKKNIQKQKLMFKDQLSKIAQERYPATS
tara:strand:+ start:813 stop:1040 length:228 start_codon:yes stop_codon:yes gene_type:complete